MFTRTMRAMRRWWGSLVLGLAVLVGGVGCSTNPATGQRQFNVLSERQEVALGSQAEPEFIKTYGGEIPDPGIRQYVKDIGMRLAEQSERRNLPWDFHVVDSAVINAFALPGGKIFITRGLMEKLENEAELAGVLGHEVGHVTAQHQGQQMSRALLISAGLMVAGAVSDEDWVRVLGGVGGTMYLLKFGRDQELQADQLGLRYMTRLNYDPRAMVRVMEILKSAGRAGGIEMLSTHPLPDTRIDALRQRIATQYAHTVNNPQFGLFADRYKAKVLEPMKKLKPPAHRPSSKPASAKSGQALRGGRRR